MRRPILIRSLVLGGAAALALFVTGCSASDDPSEVAVTSTPMASEGPALPTASPPALDQLDLGAWGARVLPKRTDATTTIGHAVPNQPVDPVDITHKDGSWTVDVACVAGDGVSLSITLASGDSQQKDQLACAADPRATPTILTLEYRGGSKTTLTVSGDAEAVFVVQSSKG